MTEEVVRGKKFNTFTLSIPGLYIANWQARGSYSNTLDKNSYYNCIELLRIVDKMWIGENNAPLQQF